MQPGVCGVEQLGNICCPPERLISLLRHRSRVIEKLEGSMLVLRSYAFDVYVLIRRVW